MRKEVRFPPDEIVRLREREGLAREDLALKAGITLATLRCAEEGLPVSVEVAALLKGALPALDFDPPRREREPPEFKARPGFSAPGQDLPRKSPPASSLEVADAQGPDSRVSSRKKGEFIQNIADWMTARGFRHGDYLLAHLIEKSTPLCDEYPYFSCRACEAEIATFLADRDLSRLQRKDCDFVIAQLDDRWRNGGQQHSFWLDLVEEMVSRGAISEPSPHSDESRALAPPQIAAPPPIQGPQSGEWEGMPRELVDHLRNLEQWHSANEKDARMDLVSFWVLKVPAIFTSAMAGVWGNFEMTTASVICGALSSFCIIVDSLHPKGALRNVHLRAVHDISILSTKMVARWRGRSQSAKDIPFARSLIRESEDERTRIATYIRDAETALKSQIDT